MRTAIRIAQITEGFAVPPLKRIKSVHGKKAFVLVTKIKELQENLFLGRNNLVALGMGT